MRLFPIVGGARCFGCWVAANIQQKLDQRDRPRGSTRHAHGATSRTDADIPLFLFDLVGCFLFLSGLFVLVMQGGGRKRLVTEFLEFFRRSVKIR